MVAAETVQGKAGFKDVTTTKICKTSALVYVVS